MPISIDKGAGETLIFLIGCHTSTARFGDGEDKEISGLFANDLLTQSRTAPINALLVDASTRRARHFHSDVNLNRPINAGDRSPLSDVAETWLLW
jgi:hypothetical protein